MYNCSHQIIYSLTENLGTKDRLLVWTLDGRKEGGPDLELVYQVFYKGRAFKRI